jgi:inositol 3-alpha-galactosyltransferase
MILLRNIDHLFSLPPGFYAVGDCYGGREYGEPLLAAPCMRTC